MLPLDIPITKVDAARRLVYGVATAEIADRAGEVCDYASTKPLYERWSEAISASTGGKSLGNLRAMHGNVAAGKVTTLTFNDAAKQIEICAKVVDDAEWAKVAEGVYTGFSQGGTYARRWTDEAGAKRYTADPHEISLVDLPCLAQARFEMIKADGSHEWRRFREAETAPPVEAATKPRDPAPSSKPVPADRLERVGEARARNSASEPVGKVGVRNSAADLERIQAMHDTSVELGASCAAQKHAVGFAPARDFDVATGLDLVKADVAKLFAGLGEQLTKSVADLSARLEAIERQPMPLPFATAARAVDKGDDGLPPERVDALLADPATLSLLAIKLAQRQGR